MWPLVCDEIRGEDRLQEAGASVVGGLLAGGSGIRKQGASAAETTSIPPRQGGQGRGVAMRASLWKQRDQRSST